MNEQLLKNNYLVVRKFIDPQYAKDLTAKFKEDAVLKNFECDPECPNSPARTNYRHFVHLLCHKVVDASRITGAELLPTYSYARWYKENAILHRHKDRPSCEISATLCLHKTESWPIFIKTPEEKEVGVELEPGDAMFYLGCVAEHWREPYTGSDHLQVFLHYVDLNGPNYPHFFDKLLYSNV